MRSITFAICCIVFTLLSRTVLEAQTDAEALNVVVGIQGQVAVKRKGWTGYAPVVFGTGLHIGDLVKLGESSHAKVVCADLSLHDVPAGIGAVPCPVSKAVLVGVGGLLLNPTRSWPSDGHFPIVVAPRKTKLMSDHPVLRWIPVSGAVRYLVIIRGQGFYWSAEESGTELVYPKSAPRLQPGIDYKLIVETNDNSSSDEPGLGLGFKLLSSKETKAILEQQEQIERMGLGDGPTQYLIAHLYAANGLYAEAIERLERVAQQFKAAAVERLLGDLDMAIGLPREAEAHYLKSLGLSAVEQDEDGEMLEHRALAYIYGEVLGNQRTASQQLQAMLDLARKLGDEQAAQEAQKKLQDLRPPS